MSKNRPIRWLSSLCLLTAHSLFGQPQEPSIVAGQAILDFKDPNSYRITTTDRAIIEWQSFGLNTGEVVRFALPSSTSAILNRVIGKEASHLLGTLESNGSVYLINPNGIIIGSNGVINTTGFLASTLDLSNDQFLALQEMKFSDGNSGSLVNCGTIRTKAGDVILLAPIVQNEGTVQTVGGNAYLISGTEVILKPDHTPLLSIRLSPSAQTLLENQGSILSFKGEAGDNFYATGIRHEESLDALQIVQKGGQIFLTAQGMLQHKGKIEAESTVTLQADRAHLQPGSEIKVQQGSLAVSTQALLNAEGTLQAPQGNVQLVSLEKGVVHTGMIDVSGEQGGSVSIEAPTYINSGTLQAHHLSGVPGSIKIQVQGPYIETAFGTVSAPGGTITVQAPRIFTSGTHSVDQAGGSAGKIIFLGEDILLPAANLSAQGSTEGHIYLGIDPQGVVYANKLHHNSATCLRATQLILSPTSLNTASLGASSSTTTTVTSPLEFIDPNQGGGSGFGTALAALSTGNIVITKPNDNLHGTNSGAVYLYNASTAALISTLTGSNDSDFVGDGGITALTGNGNYVVTSSRWDGNIGAATWGSGTTGASGVVSSTNSLVGETPNDNVSFGGVTALTNGNYVVKSPRYKNVITGQVTAGAATWGSGTTGITGTVSTTNSLVGTVSGDQVSSGGVVALTNGNYVVVSPNWDGPAAKADIGAVTWGNGTTGITGNVTNTNSLVGVTPNDQAGSSGVTALSNGNYVVLSPNWDNGASSDVGAATWGNGTTGITGNVTDTNSLVGTSSSDQVGNIGATALTNGNYVVLSDQWANGLNGTITIAGAATWGNGTTGITGNVAPSNSLVGAAINDQVGSGGTLALTNGNYVVKSSSWNGGFGAVTWGNGTTGTTGDVSNTNSLVGTAGSDHIGNGGATALTNGNYVVRSNNWNSNFGAVTWGNGTTGITGNVSASNSLVGGAAPDTVGSNGVTALTNGNYVVSSPFWNGQVGASTWGNGTTGITGTVSASNSLIGSTSGDFVGAGATAFSNGNYVVTSPIWHNGNITGAGAVTWGNGTTGITGTVSISNSLVGSTASDSVGSDGVLDFGVCYAVVSPNWDNGSLTDAGAVSIGSPSTGLTGFVTTNNSIVGLNTSTSLAASRVVYSSEANRVIAGFRFESGSGRVRSGIPTFSPSTSRDFSRGLNNFQRAIGNIFDSWRCSLYGGVLDQTPYLPYRRQTEPLQLPSLLQWPFKAQSDCRFSEH